VTVAPDSSFSGAAPAAWGPSGVMAKYGDSVSSWRQTTRAPSWAAIRMPVASAS